MQLSTMHIFQARNNFYFLCANFEALILLVISLTSYADESKSEFFFYKLLSLVSHFGTIAYCSVQTQAKKIHDNVNKFI